MRCFLAGIVAISGLCLPGATPAFGQDFLKKEVFGVIGIGKTYDDEGSLGAGVNVAGGFGYRLWSRFGVEAEVNAFRTRRDFGSAYPPFRANGAHVMGSGLLYLSRGRGQAYLLLGGGLVRTHVNRSANGVGFNFGGGMKIFVKPHLSLRPELRIYVGTRGGVVETPFVDIRTSMGVGYHW